MATTDPVQQFSGEIRTLQNSLNSLQGKVQLASIRDAVEDLQSNVQGMPQRLASLRAQGYVFENELEPKAQSFIESWGLLYPNIQSQINRNSANLVNTLRPIETQMPQLSAFASNPGMGQALLSRLKSGVGQVESKVDAAEKSIRGMYDQFERQVNVARKHLDDIEYMLTQLAEASFQLMPTEAGIAAVKAVWYKSGKEQKNDPEGVLFLTDQRILFEQKEEIAKKKVLFVVTEKEKVQTLQFEAPVPLVEKVETEKKGMLKNEDHIEIQFATGAPLRVTNFHIWQDNAVWQGLINRAKSKDFDQGRTEAVDPSALEKVKSAPAQCPSCGGNITTVVLRGMDSITCEYCGYVIRL